MGTGQVLLRRAHFKKLGCWRDCVLPPAAQHGLPLLMVGAAAGIVYACFCDNVFTLHIDGMTGALLGPDKATIRSVWSMAPRISYITTQGPPVLMWMLEIFFITTTIVTPLCFLGICAIIWGVP